MKKIEDYCSPHFKGRVQVVMNKKKNKKTRTLIPKNDVTEPKTGLL